MNFKKKMERCAEFFNALGEALGDDYEIVGSINDDKSAYLIPKGSIDQLSYYGKPDRSIRISDHWNWYSSLKKCKDPDMIQCESVDIPWERNRTCEGRASKPIIGAQVAVYGADGKYHHVYGERYDRWTERWNWRERSISDVVKLLKSM